MKYTIAIWVIIISALIAYTVLLSSTMKEDMQRNCILGAMKAKGEPPSKTVIDWCNTNF